MKNLRVAFANRTSLVKGLMVTGAATALALSGSASVMASDAGNGYGYGYGSNSPIPTTVYRAFNASDGDHFYTASLNEWNGSSVFGYVKEGIAFTAVQDTKQGATPVYRLLDSRGDHFYTASLPEAMNAVSTYGYHLEGIAFSAWATQFDAPGNGTSSAPAITKVGRMLSATSGDHFYTASSAEETSALTSFGYNSEGTAFWIQ